MSEKRYFIGYDGSTHKYLVPFDKHKEWEAWANLDPDDEASWEEPEYAERLDGALLTFTNPREEPSK